MKKNPIQHSSESRKSVSSLLWFFLKGCKGYFIASILLTGLSSLADMLSPQIIRAAVDNALGGTEPSYPAPVMALVNSLGGFAYLGKHLWIMASAVLAVALVKVLSQYFFRVTNVKGSETLVRNMRDSLYTHIETLPFEWHVKNQTGDIIQRCTSDIETTKNFVAEQLTSIFRIVLLVVLSTFFMFTMNVPLTLIALLPVPLIVGYSLRFHSNMKKEFLECDESEGRLSAAVQENLTGVRVVRAFAKENHERTRFDEKNQELCGLWVKMSKLLGSFWSISDVFSGIQLMLVVVFGTVFCVRGSMLSGEYIAFISYTSMMMWPIRQLGRMLSEMSKAGVSMERIRYIMESESEKDLPEAGEPDLSGDICFDHVSFGYSGCPEMLHDICLSIPSGTTLGILGATGSGKSTLIYLLDKLYDLPEGNGSITIGGIDLRKIKSAHLRRNIGIVLQEPYLFSRTLKENLMIARPDASEDEIASAAQTACLDETINDFSKGYETMVGERGVTLSGGQKQRAAIARMLLRKTPIMVLDDSLSAVDTETDEKIRKKLEKRFGSATIILISHRITTLSKADQIIVMENGRIAERGTPEELRQNGGIYSKIYQIQSFSGEEVDA